MMDQDRREEVAENELPRAAEASRAQTDSETIGANPGSAAQFTPETQDEPPAEAQTEGPAEVESEVSVEAGDEEQAELPAEAPVELPADEPVELQVDGSTDADIDGSAEPQAEQSSEMQTDELSEVQTAVEPQTDAPAEEQSLTEQVIEETADGIPGASFTPVEEENDSVRPRRLKDLEVGMELDGRVTSVALYGVFVDIGVGRDGLVHISEMSDTRIDSPSDIVQIGDTVKVRIKGLDVDARRISLTMRSQRERIESRGRVRAKRADVDRDALSGLKVGDTVEGVITGMAPFGAFADIGVGKDGLVHISELSEGRVDKPEDAVQVGERYIFKLLEVDPEGTRISLSLRRAQRAQKMQQLETGQIIEGTVSGLAPFGAFVDIGVGRDGLVHISELAEGRVGKVEDVVKVDDRVKVRVLEVDSQSKRISLTMRLEERPVEELPGATTPDDRPRGGGRVVHTAPSEPKPAAETYPVNEDSEEDFTGNATLEDLLSKFGGVKRKERRRTKDEEEEEEDDDRFTRRQRDAIRRTLQQVGNDE